MTQDKISEAGLASRRCAKCGELKHPDAFPVMGGTMHRGRLHSYCKPCKYQTRNRTPETVEAARERNRRYYHRKKAAQNG